MGDAAEKPVAQSQSRDEIADFASVVHQHQPRLLRYASRMLNGDQEAAQDIVQETFLRFWQHRARYTPQDRLESYLLRVAHNLCIDFVRIHRPIIPLEESFDAASKDAAVDNKVCADAFDAAVRAAIATLPEGQRSVFILSEYEGLRYQEIAVLLECPMGTVASRKHLAVLTLRRRLAHWFEESK